MVSTVTRSTPVSTATTLQLCSNEIDDSNKTELGMAKQGNIYGKFNPEALTFRPKQAPAAIATTKLNDMIEENELPETRSAMLETCRLPRSTYDLVKMLVKFMHKNLQNQHIFQVLCLL